MTFSLHNPRLRVYYIAGGRLTPRKDDATKYFKPEDAANVALFRGLDENWHTVENEPIQWPNIVQRENGSVLVGRFGDVVPL